MRIGTRTSFRSWSVSLCRMLVSLRVLLSSQEVGGMSQPQHGTKTILFHRKYYHDSVVIFDYLTLNVMTV